jgi:hypothetical protein
MALEVDMKGAMRSDARKRAEEQQREKSSHVAGHREPETDTPRYSFDQPRPEKLQR